jgi:hypothetical protein
VRAWKLLLLGLLLLAAGCDDIDHGAALDAELDRIERMRQYDPPEVSIECPGSAKVGPGPVEFPYSLSKAAPGDATLRIEYGDGRHYSTSILRDSDIERAFWHDYTRPGTYRVLVRLTDSKGRSAQDSCRLRVRPSN